MNLVEEEAKVIEAPLPWVTYTGGGSRVALKMETYKTATVLKVLRMALLPPHFLLILFSAISSRQDGVH